MVALERQESVVALHVGHKAGAGLVKILRVKSGPRGSFRLTQLNARLFHRRLKLKLLVTDNLLAAALQSVIGGRVRHALTSASTSS